jgi:hypothetical protein
MAKKPTDLMTFLRANPAAKKFVPYCYLDKDADTLTVYFEGDADYSKRLTEHVTLFLSMDTGETIGCRIKGISGIIDDLPNYLSVNHNGINLSLVFLPFRGSAADQATREALNELAKEASQRQMVLEPSL